MFPALLLAVSTASLAPDFAWPTTHGEMHLSDLRGKPVVVNFWASWCHPCTDELKYFVRARDEYGSKIEVVTVSSQLHDVAASYLRLWNIDLPLVEDLDGSIAKTYGVPPIPVTVVVDRTGTIRYVSVGELSWPELQAAVDRVLAPAPTSTQPGGVLR